MSQTSVDFYLLEDSTDDAKWLLACRLAEKAYLRRHQVFIYCDCQDTAEMLDELMWIFKENSFIPHNIQGEGPKSPPPIQIGYAGYTTDPAGFSDILFNLSDEIPVFHQRFKRIIEIVPHNDTEKEISREHYRQYRINGLKIQTHSIPLKENA